MANGKFFARPLCAHPCQLDKEKKTIADHTTPKINQIKSYQMPNFQLIHFPNVIESTPLLFLVRN